MISLVGTKIVVMVLTGLVPIILGLLPWKIGRNINQENRRHQITISCLLCFGAGILLALSLLHMLPEVIFSRCFALYMYSGTVSYENENVSLKREVLAFCSLFPSKKRNTGGTMAASRKLSF